VALLRLHRHSSYTIETFLMIDGAARGTYRALIRPDGSDDVLLGDGASPKDAIDAAWAVLLDR
jgi:hypothetical protein